MIFNFALAILIKMALGNKTGNISKKFAGLNIFISVSLRVGFKSHNFFVSFIYDHPCFLSTKFFILLPMVNSYSHSSYP